MDENKIQELFPNIILDYSLAELTSFKIGGKAKYFLASDNIEEIQLVIRFCLENDVKFKVIGSGYNLLISDDGFDGLIIKLNNESISYENNGVFIVGGGLELISFIVFALQNNCVGSDFLVGIPGSLGGAIYGNAGSYGNDISDIIISVRIIDFKGEVIELGKEECDFSYRNSRFKYDDCMIFDAVLKLQEGDTEEFKLKMIDRIKLRNSKHPMEYKNAGSFFKNIEITEDVKLKLKDKLDISQFEGKKIPSAFLIESLGLKGLSVGDAEVSEKHANFLINKGKASAKDMFDLVNLIQEKVFQEFKIKLEPEVQFVGDFNSTTIA